VWIEPTLVTSGLLDADDGKDLTGTVPASAMRERLLEAAAGAGIWELDPRSGRMRLGPGACALHGLSHPAPPEAATLSAWRGRLHPEDRVRADAALELAARDGVPLRIEFRVRRPDGGWRWLECRGALAEPDGPPRLVGLDLDITPRKEREARALLALREVEHRAKNALSTAQALVRLTRAGDPRNFARLVDQRLAALGRAHARLSAAPPGSGFALRQIAEDEFAPYGPDTLALHGEAVALSGLAVQPVCMVLHELATNAAKYGALSRPGGRVRLRWRRLAGGRLLVSWREAGGPAVRVAPDRRGFGMAMLDALLRGQLGGTIRFGWQSDGLRVTMLLPEECVAEG
jgi:PAS domain S-box-containing protein